MSEGKRKTVRGARIEALARQLVGSRIVRIRFRPCQHANPMLKTWEKPAMMGFEVFSQTGSRRTAWIAADRDGKTHGYVEVVPSKLPLLEDIDRKKFIAGVDRLPPFAGWTPPIEQLTNEIVGLQIASVTLDRAIRVEMRSGHSLNLSSDSFGTQPAFVVWSET